MGSGGQIIGLKLNEKKYKRIIRKLLMDEELTDGEKEFLEKKGIDL